MKTISLTLLSLFLLMDAAPDASLRITVHGLRTDKGSVLLSVYPSADGFPSNDAKAIRTAKLKIAGGTAEVVFDKLPEGTYAVSMLHDENGNGKMDTGLFGIPKEGYGASNDAKATFGPPSFDDAKFEVAKETAIRIRTRYF